MTTKLQIRNAACSNGDVHIDTRCGATETTQTLLPGQEAEMYISTSHEIAIKETWPSVCPAGEIANKGEQADELIAKEVATQDKMWGDANERADAMNGQLLGAALAQASAIYNAGSHGVDRKTAFEFAEREFYPRDWSGYRDYGSDIANLVVAAAYLRNEIKRRLLKGESTYRAPRQKSYTGDQPYMSSAEAGAH